MLEGAGELYEDGPLAPDYELSMALMALAQIMEALERCRRCALTMRP